MTPSRTRSGSVTAYRLDPCENCGRERDEHTEAEAIVCLVRSLRADGVKVILPPGKVIS
jgi:hypothetical protein